MKKIDSFLFIKDKKLEVKVSESLLKFNSINILDKTNDEIDFIEKCRYFTPNLLFIEINNKAEQTIELINLLKKTPLLIAITDNKTQINSYLENLFMDIIPKNFTAELFTKKVCKVIRLFDFISVSNNQSINYVAENNIKYYKNKDYKGDNYIFIKNKKIVEKIIFDQVLFIQNKDNIISFFLSDGKTITLISSLKKVQNQLPQNKFIKISNSLIINISKIEILSKNVIHIQHYRLPITRTYLPNLKYILQL